MSAITISSGGGSAGLFSYRSEVGGFTVSVLVLPKLWGLQRSGSLTLRDGHARLSVLLSEYESVSISLDSLSAADTQARTAFAGGISELTHMLQKRRAQWRAQQRVRSGTKAPAIALSAASESAADDEASAASIDSADESVSVPVDCGLRFELTASNAKQASADDNSPRLASSLRDLVWLCYRNRKMKSSSDEGGGDETGGLLLDPKTDEAQDPLALLAELDFVSEMHRLQHRIRKGYVSEEDRLASIRGRITDRGVLDFEMTGIPLLECRFDEFVEATPLFRVLVTALDVVASGTLRDALGVGSDWFGSSSDLHPATLREQLRNLPSLPRPVARATADRLRLTRLQHEWQRPLDLARRILRAESTDTGAADSEGGATIWSIEMPALWERLLTQALNRQPDCRAMEQAEVLQPWVGMGASRRADIVLEHRGKPYLLDAKYKDGSKGASPADQYQIFAYSLLRRPAPVAVALVYPLPAGSRPSPRFDASFARAITNLETNDTEIARPDLHLLQLPFPSQTVVRDEFLWKDYLGEVGAGLVGELSPT